MNPLDINTFYFELPLYAKIQIDESNKKEFITLLKYNGTTDYYNPLLKENTTFELVPCDWNGIEHFYQYGGQNTFKMRCVRTDEEFLIYVYFNKTKNTFEKTGQHPSIATFHISQIKQYDKVLNSEKLKEFTRAIGLAANGVGIGSFVYLRRIFEDLIEEAHIEAKKESDWDEDKYMKQKVAEKIETLKTYLPDFLVENKSLYGILSKGIHSLTEKECLVNFETVKIGIELILDEKVEKMAKQLKIEEARKKIAQATQNMKKP